jgi:hypothetical protein
LLEPLLLGLDLLELLLELELALFLEPLELPDLVGMGTLPSAAITTARRNSGSAKAHVPLLFLWNKWDTNTAPRAVLGRR